MIAITTNSSISVKAARGSLLRAAATCCAQQVARGAQRVAAALREVQAGVG
jgi:hypothetical protein